MFKVIFIFFLILDLNQNPKEMTDQNERPTFLTVLCILTWVGSGLVFIGQLFTLATSGIRKNFTALAEDGMDEAMSELAEEPSGIGSIISSFVGQGMQALENLTEIALIKMLGTAIVILGAVLMWKLKKTGFYLFLGGKVIIIVGVFILMGGSRLAVMSIMGSLIVAIAFGIMYGVNTKAMS